MMKAAFITYIIFSVFVDCYPTQLTYGRWYGDKVAQNVTTIDVDVNKANTVRCGLLNRNLLLSDDGYMCINNMYPIKSVGYMQLIDVLNNKQLIDKNCIFLLQTTPWYECSPVPYINAFYNFVSAVSVYLNAFVGYNMPKTSKALSIVNTALELFNRPRNYQTLNNIINYLTNFKNMQPVWEFMHTEFLYVFHCYYLPSNKMFAKQYLSSYVVSHYDMCDSCEYLMLYLIKSGVLDSKNGSYSGNRGVSDYCILFASFCEYRGSRNRDGDNCELLKVVLA